MCPAKLKKRTRLLLVLQIRRKKVATDTAQKIVAKRVMQNFTATRSINLEKSKKLRYETPSPLQLAVLLETRLVNVQMTLLLQKLRKFIVRRLESGGNFFDLFRKKTGRDVNTHDITEVFFQCTIGGMNTSLEITCQGGHVRSEETGFFDFFGQANVMIAFALLAPIHQLLIFGDVDRFFDEIDLLKRFRFCVFQIEFVSAVGTVGEFEFDDFIDQFGCDGLSEVLLVTGLGSLFAFFLFVVFVLRFGRFDDVGGGRFGGVLRVLFEHRDFFECGFVQCCDLCNLFLKF